MASRADSARLSRDYEGRAAGDAMTISGATSSQTRPHQKMFRHVEERLDERYGLIFGKDQIRGIERYIRDKGEGERLFSTIRWSPVYRGRKFVGRWPARRWIYRITINNRVVYPVLTGR